MIHGHEMIIGHKTFPTFHHMITDVLLLRIAMATNPSPYLDANILHASVEGCAVLLAIYQHLVAGHSQVRVTLDTSPADVGQHVSCQAK